MNSPIAALAWEIWRRGRRAAWLVLACIVACAFIHLVAMNQLHLSDGAKDVFSLLFGMLMVVSFLLLMGIFNYTEYNSTREWNGFPYRLFTLPVRTWQLVALPMFLCLLWVEVTYFAWIKLVWTREDIHTPGWFAIVFGAYVIFYQTIIWSLAGFRIARIVALGFGGVSVIAVASLPMLGTIIPSPWLTEQRLIPMIIGSAVISSLIAWATVARQRCGGGRRQSWVTALTNRLVDALPARTRDFASPSAAQFWYEWRRCGWLLPVCTAFVLLTVVLPISWYKRHDPHFVNYVLLRLLAAPLVLAFVVGKNFMNCEFWSANLAIPNFMAVRPLPAREFVATKLKIAAVSVVVTWALVLIFLVSWLTLWANHADVSLQFFRLHVFYPHGWPFVLILSCVALMVLTWRLMVSGLWVGLSGSRVYYIGAIALQVLIPALCLLAAGIWSDAIDQKIKKDPVFMQSLAIEGISWILAALVIAKYWFAAFSWSQHDRAYTRRYLLAWAAGLACLLALAILAWPPFDTYRWGHFFVLGALLIFPIGRLGIAPLSLEKNRHRSFDPVIMPRLKLNKPLAVLAVLISGIAIVFAVDPGRFVFQNVDAGGHPLRMFISGHGGPAVVFETGGSPADGGALDVWNRVQPAISKVTTTVSYDRAGIAWSPDGPKPRDALQVARELHTALGNAHVPPPYVLVGHSLGGPLIRVFAGMYPDEVAGLVLVDPTQEEFIFWNMARQTNQVARQDQEWKDIKASLDEAHESRVPAGIPVTLITAMGPRVLPDFIPEKDRQEFKILKPMWLHYHEEWLAKIPGARHIVTLDSGHGVPIEKPDLVIDPILQMVEQIRVQHGPVAERR